VELLQRSRQEDRIPHGAELGDQDAFGIEHDGPDATMGP
jgi:hypothetical protein